MAPPPLPPWDDAIAALRGWLASRGVRGEIRWLFAEDVVDVRGRFLTRSASAAAERAAREEYAAAAQRGLGAKLCAVAWRDGELYCTLEHPVDREAALRLMTGGLTLSINTRPRTVVVLPSLFWRLLRRLRPGITAAVPGRGGAC